jgi:uncharacterized protein (DUF362 family)
MGSAVKRRDQEAADHGVVEPPAGLVTRRGFLRQAGMAAAGLLLGGCGSQAVPGREQAEVPTLEGPAVRPLEGTSTPSVAPLTAPSAKVATAWVDEYDKLLVREELASMFDGLGGIADVVRPGDKVAIKVNCTGGSYQSRVGGLPHVESFWTHPVVVEAVAELMIDVGAGEIYIVEAVKGWRSYTLFGYDELAARLGATLIDLNSSEPYGSFSEDEVGEGWFVYERFSCNRVLSEVDALVSVSKLKSHVDAGVTHTMKNLVGIVPCQLYELMLAGQRGRRSSFHGVGRETKARLPRVIVDLNRAHPVQIGVVDGIKTMEGGEGPWNAGIRPVEPGVLLAGKSALAVDAVATAVMGFDPTAEYPNAPFLHCDNHLDLARELGLGTNRLEEIAVVGPPVEELVTSFKTVQAPAGGGIAAAIPPPLRD